MKYRRLDLAELHTLESDFIKFLATNHITAADWQKLKKENPKKMEGLLDIYSEIVWEKTLSNIQYLEFIRSNDCKVFYCEEDEIHLIGFSIEPSVGVDLRSMNLVLELPELFAEYSNQIKLYRSNRPYQKERKLELYDLLESGCLIAKTGHLYQFLAAIAEK